MPCLQSLAGADGVKPLSDDRDKRPKSNFSIDANRTAAEMTKASCQKPGLFEPEEEFIPAELRRKSKRWPTRMMV